MSEYMDTGKQSGWCNHIDVVTKDHRCDGHPVNVRTTCHDAFAWLPHKCTGHRPFVNGQAMAWLSSAKLQASTLIRYGHNLEALNKRPMERRPDAEPVAKRPKTAPPAPTPNCRSAPNNA